MSAALLYGLCALIGCLLSLWIEQSVFAGVVGAVLGLLWARLIFLSQSLRSLQRRIEQRPDAPVPEQPASRTEPPDVRAPGSATPEVIAPAFATSHERTGPITLEELRKLEREHNAADEDRSAAAPALGAAAARGSESLERWVKRAWRWETTGNVPVKIGILVLFVGVAALLKYASDRGLLSAPITVRIAAVAAAAVVALGFGWWQRKRRRNFALALQGGAIGVLIMTVFTAFRLYALLPPVLAFALLVVLVACAGLLAVLQDSLSLAVLGLVAGFAAPILISTGQGNHIALFGYYAVLNFAILAIAWKKSWRLLNLLGFVATFGVGTAWGVLSYQPKFFATTEPFLILDFLFYLAIPWLYLRHESAHRDKVMDGALLFGNPLASLLLQGSLLQWRGTELAFSALAAAGIYVLAAWGMRNRPRTDVLRDAWAVLAVLFATLAVPLALSASLTASVLALEGAGLVWLGFRQERRLPRWGGLALQLYAGISLLVSYSQAHAGAWLPLINRDFLGAMLIVAGGLSSCALYHRHGRNLPATTAAAVTAYAWSMLWWLGATTAEIARALDGRAELAALWLLAAITAWILSEAARRTSRSLLAAVMAWTDAGLTSISLAFIAFCLAPDWQPFAGWLLLAVAVTLAAGWRTLANLREHRGAGIVTQILWWWRWLFVAGVAILVALSGWLWLADSWRGLLVLAPAVMLWFVCMRRADWLAPPLRSLFPAARPWLLHSLTVLMTLAFVVGMFFPGDAAPLFYLPILNPLDLLLLAIASGLALWCADVATAAEFRRLRPLLFGIGGTVLVTSITLRAVHQLGGVAWGIELARSSLAQLSLTVVWSVFGVLAWLWGSRKNQRPIWLAGAIMMGVVLFKLLLVDRSHLGNFFGISSFIAYGLLCTIIGYFAPSPFRQARKSPGGTPDAP